MGGKETQGETLQKFERRMNSWETHTNMSVLPAHFNIMKRVSQIFEEYHLPAPHIEFEEQLESYDPNTTYKLKPFKLRSLDGKAFDLISKTALGILATYKERGYSEEMTAEVMAQVIETGTAITALGSQQRERYIKQEVKASEDRQKAKNPRVVEIKAGLFSEIEIEPENAKKAGLHPKMIEELRKGKTTVRKDMLPKIATAVNAPIHELLANPALASSLQDEMTSFCQNLLEQST